MLFLVIIAWALSLSAGICDAASRIFIKGSKVHNFTLISIGLLFALPLYLVWLAFEGIPPFDPGFWVAVSLHVPLFTIATACMVEAHRRSPLTLTVPYLSLTPAFLLVVNPLMGIFFPELQVGSVAVMGVVGVIIVTCGLYILNIEKGEKNFFKPFLAFRNEKGSQLMLVTAILFSITACLDYVALVHSNAPFYLFVDHGLASIIVGAMIIGYVKYGRLTREAVSPRNYWKGLMFFGFIFSISVTVHMIAFEYIPTVPYIIVGKRIGSILFTIFLGLVMGFIIKHKDFLKERENLKYRLPGACIAMIGMVIIVVWGKI